jgi:hypothetical protein
MLKVVEEFIEVENNKLNRLEKLFGNYPDFYFLKGSSAIEDISNYNLEKVIIIRQSVLSKIVPLFFILFGLYPWCMFFLMVVLGELLPVTIPMLLFASAWVGAILWTYFLNPKSSFRVIVSKAGMGIGKFYFTWNNLADAIVMQKGGGRHQRTTLVLFTVDGQIHKYSLNNLSVSFEKLLPIIENYQTRSRQHL